MSRLPESLAKPLAALAAAGSPAAVAGAMKDLLAEGQRFDDLARAFEALREAVRSFGILDEARSGERVYDGWFKLSHFFMGSLVAWEQSLRSPAATEAPAGHEAMGGRWERLAPEFEAFLEEKKAIEEALGQAPSSAHVAFKFRSRLLLLDRRAERIQVICDLLRRDVTVAVVAGLERLAAGGSAGAARAGARRAREVGVDKNGGDS
jgi:hypothetical protein